MGLQVFGTRKCPDTRKAERYLKERGIAYQFIDLVEVGISLGELKAVAAACGGARALLNERGARFKEKGLGYMDFEPEEELERDPLLLRTPIIRDGRRAILGYDPEALKAFLAASTR
jgi:Arsenate reductase and related proteins, glutaredoxin family